MATNPLDDRGDSDMVEDPILRSVELDLEEKVVDEIRRAGELAVLTQVP